jgi:hypothetical protein
MSIEAMKQALEALDAPTSPMLRIIQEEAITSLRQAIEQAEKQEPVATVVSENKPVTMSWWHEPALLVGTKLYTTPQPQREWVGLTDEEVTQQVGDSHILRDVVRAVEHVLKEKNHE